MNTLLQSLNKPHLKFIDIAPLIEACQKLEYLSVGVVGHSYLQREIYQISLGHGPICILAWSQMHGDEPTATAAIFDLLIEMPKHEQFEQIAKTFTIHFVPMLNPDGAEMQTRQNAQGIDINRDAVQLQSPEGQLLKKLVSELSPEIVFNLHDQAHHYKSGLHNEPATIAFLAPPFDQNRSIKPSRLRAMQIITRMRDTLESYIPNSIARYNDEYSNKCFGDSIAQTNTSVILIESGEARGDPNRQIARKMNRIAIITAVESLLEDAYFDVKNSGSQEQSILRYNAIPMNVSGAYHDLILENVTVSGKSSYTVDIATNRLSNTEPSQTISFIGDLRGHSAHVLFDAAKLEFESGKVFLVSEETNLNDTFYLKLLKNGYIAFYNPDNLLTISTNLPVFQSAVQSDFKWCQQSPPSLHQPAYGLLVKDSSICFALLNGQMIDLSKTK